MEVIEYKEHNLPTLRRRIGVGSSSISYLTSNNEVLKSYYNNEYYKKILANHDNGFLNYLIELDKNPSELLCKNNAVYLKGNEVMCVKHEYLDGQTIDQILPRTSVDDFLEAIKEYDKMINNLNNLILSDMHYKNIFYVQNKDGINQIKLSDLDFCRISSYKNMRDIKFVNMQILKGLFHFDVRAHIEVEKRLQDIYSSLENMEVGLYEFLVEYVNLLRNYKDVSAIRDLSKDFIREKTLLKK